MTAVTDRVSRPAAHRAHDCTPGPERAHDSLGLDRRTVLVGMGTTCAAALAGCGTGGTGGTDSTGQAPGTPVASTSDIPVGGGKIFREYDLVVTQPAVGRFSAFSATCTHQGCTVTTVEDGTINCPCHGSSFAITDGTVTNGPASRSLPAREITTTGASIKIA